jgi:hypothetical protein
MTRIRFDGSRGKPASQPLWQLPEDERRRYASGRAVGSEISSHDDRAAEAYVQ